MTEFNTKEYTKTKCEAFKRGTSVKKLFGTMEKSADVANNDKLIIMHNVSVDSILHAIKITNTAMAGFTGAKIVVLNPNSKDIIKNGEADVLLAENISLAEVKNNVDILPLAYKNKSLSQIINKSNDVFSSVDIAIVSAAVGSAVGSIYFEIEFSSPFN